MSNKPKDETLQPKKRAFLAALVEAGGSITRAAEATRMSRQRHYEWLREDPEYATAFGEAEIVAAHRLEDEARRRGFEGVQEPIYQNGRQVGQITRYSDTLLIFLLNGIMPEKYRQRSSVDLKGTLGVNAKLEVVLSQYLAELRAGTLELDGEPKQLVQGEVEDGGIG